MAIIELLILLVLIVIAVLITVSKFITITFSLNLKVSSQQKEDNIVEITMFRKDLNQDNIVSVVVSYMQSYHPHITNKNVPNHIQRQITDVLGRNFGTVCKTYQNE